jgi:hypothetical protein
MKCKVVVKTDTAWGQCAGNFIPRRAIRERDPRFQFIQVLTEEVSLI